LKFNNKYIPFLAIVPIAFIFLGFKKSTVKGVFSLPKRDCDAGGCGYYGASRGSRLHKGVDYLIAKGENVYSFKGDLKVKRYVDPYGDGVYSGVELVEVATGVVYKIMYMQPTVMPGALISKGQKLGVAQDISEKYSSVQPHLHIEVLVNGQHVNPSTYL